MLSPLGQCKKSVPSLDYNMRCFLVMSVLLAVLSADAKDVCPQDSVNSNLKKSVSVDRWFGKDKGDHFAASAFLIGMGFYVTRQELNMQENPAQMSAAAFSFSLGICKEVYDKYHKKSHFCFKDLAADLAGIAFGITILNLNNR